MHTLLTKGTKETETVKKEYDLSCLFMLSYV